MDKATRKIWQIGWVILTAWIMLGCAASKPVEDKERTPQAMRAIYLHVAYADDAEVGDKTRAACHFDQGIVAEANRVAYKYHLKVYPSQKPLAANGQEQVSLSIAKIETYAGNMMSSFVTTATTVTLKRNAEGVEDEHVLTCKGGSRGLRSLSICSRLENCAKKTARAMLAWLNKYPPDPARLSAGNRDKTMGAEADEPVSDTTPGDQDDNMTEPETPVQP